TAAATVALTLASVDGGTEGTVSTDLAITGRPAQFGRGLIAEVGGKILNAFSECLSGKLGTASSSEESPGQSADEGAKAPPAPEGQTKPHSVPSGQTKPHDEPASEPIDLMEFAGASVAKRAAPIAAVLLALIIFLVIRRRGK